MCECYKIGGPWITFDPDCPAHGYEAQAREKQLEEDREEARREKQELIDRIETLESQVRELNRIVGHLANDAAQQQLTRPKL